MEVLQQYKEDLQLLKDKIPEGLFKEWDSLEPLGLINWGSGMDILKDVQNSYNWIDMDKDSNNIVFQAGKINEEHTAVAFHIRGDVRGNYTDYFIFETSDIEGLLMPLSLEEWEAYGGKVEE